MKSPSTVAACPDRTVLNAKRALRQNRLIVHFLGGLSIGALVLAAPRSSAAPPPVTVSQPVEVEVVNPVEVHGTVEVLNDALKTPYYLQLASSFLGGSAGAESELALIPDGKRFVVETVTAFARTPAGQYPSVSLTLLRVNGAPADAQQGDVQLLLEPQGVFDVGGDTVFWKGTYPLKMLVDSGRNGIRANVFRSASTDQGLFWVSLVGYLEDL
jgi:hypothetical protein